MDAWKNRSEGERFVAQAFYRLAQQETMERLWNSQSQLFYRKDRKSITKTGVHPQGFYRTDLVEDLHRFGLFFTGQMSSDQL